MFRLEDDRELLQQFRAGKRSALEVVYRAYVADVSRVIHWGFAVDSQRRVSGVPSPQEQADLLQEIFLRAFSDKARLAYDGLRSYRAYLLQIARNTMVDRVRKSGRELLARTDQSLELDEMIDRDAPIPNFEGDLDWNRQREVTRAWLSAISADAQRFVELRFVERRSQQDVADALAISRRAVITWERKLLKELKGVLKQKGVL